MSHRLSVLIPNYNNAPYLKEALDSVFDQTYKDFKVYFIDDCSTDNSLEIVRSYNDERLIILEKDKNSGIVDTLNIGLKEIDSRYFIRMDGDDISTPDRFEILMKFMEDHPEIGVCSSAMKTFGKVNNTIYFEKNPALNRANLIFGHSIGHAPSIFRTEVFKKNKIEYKDDFWQLEDYYLFYRLSKYSDFTAIEDVLYHYRREEYNLNDQIESKKRKEFMKLYELIFEDLRLEFDKGTTKLHLQLAHRAKPQFSLSQYQMHVKNLLKANQKVEIFPSEELKNVLDQKLDRLVFRLVDEGLIKGIEVFKRFTKSPGLLKYYLSSLLKK